MFNRRLYAIWFLVVLSNGALAYQPSPAVESINNLQNVVGGEYSFSEVALSPNGENITWLEVSNSEICTHAFETGETNCLVIPWEDGYFGSTTYPDWYISWSADSQYIAFSRHPFGTYLFDTDLWLFDSGKGEIRNITEDGITIFTESSESVDFYPVWNPQNGTLYFQRATVEAQDLHPKSLSMYALEPPYNQAPVKVADLDEFYAYAQSVALSPDGQKMAMYLYDSDMSMITPDIRNYDDTDNGVYILDVETAEMTKVVGLDDLLGEMPAAATAWIPGTRTSSTAWSPDGEGLVTGGKAISDDGTLMAVNFYYLDIESKGVIPLSELRELEIDNFRDFKVDQLPFQLFMPPNSEWAFSVSFVSGHNELALTQNAVPFGDSEFAVIAEGFSMNQNELGSIYAISQNGNLVANGQLVKFRKP